MRFRSSVDEPLTFFQERRTRRVRQNIAPPRARRSTPLVSLPASVHRCCVRFHCSPPPSSSSPPSLPRVASRRSSLYSTTRGKRAGAPLSVSTGRSASRRAAPRRSSLYSTRHGTRAGAPLSVSTGLVSRSRSFSLVGSSTGRATALATSTRTSRRPLSLSSVVANRARREKRVLSRAGCCRRRRHRCRHHIRYRASASISSRAQCSRLVRIGSRPWLVRATRNSRAMEIRTRVSRRGGCCTVVNHRTWRHNGARSPAIRV